MPPTKKPLRQKRLTPAQAQADEPIDLASVALPLERPSRPRTRKGQAARDDGPRSRPRRSRPAAREDVEPADAAEVETRRAAPAPSLLEQAVRKVVLRFVAMGCLAIVGLAGLGVLSLIGSFLRPNRVAEAEATGRPTEARSDGPAESGVTVVAALRDAADRAPSAEESGPGDAAAKDAFDAANRRINVWSGQAGFGNTPRAEEMATCFSEDLQALQAMCFTGGADESTRASMTDGKFISYCQLTDDRVVFLVHVPQLKNYKGEVRERLLDLACVTALEVVDSYAMEFEGEVAMALRGAVFFGGLAVGGYGQGDVRWAQKSGAVVDVSSLHGAFARRASTAAAATAADR